MQDTTGSKAANRRYNLGLELNTSQSTMLSCDHMMDIVKKAQASASASQTGSPLALAVEDVLRKKRDFETFLQATAKFREHLFLERETKMDTHLYPFPLFDIVQQFLNKFLDHENEEAESLRHFEHELSSALELLLSGERKQDLNESTQAYLNEIIKRNWEKLNFAEELLEQMTKDLNTVVSHMDSKPKVFSGSSSDMTNNFNDFYQQLKSIEEVLLSFPFPDREPNLLSDLSLARLTTKTSVSIQIDAIDTAKWRRGLFSRMQDLKSQFHGITKFMEELITPTDDNVEMTDIEDILASTNKPHPQKERNLQLVTRINDFNQKCFLETVEAALKYFQLCFPQNVETPIQNFRELLMDRPENESTDATHNEATQHTPGGNSASVVLYQAPQTNNWAHGTFLHTLELSAQSSDSRDQARIFKSIREMFSNAELARRKQIYFLVMYVSRMVDVFNRDAAAADDGVYYDDGGGGGDYDDGGGGDYDDGGGGDYDDGDGGDYDDGDGDGDGSYDHDGDGSYDDDDLAKKQMKRLKDIFDQQRHLDDHVNMTQHSPRHEKSVEDSSVEIVRKQNRLNKFKKQRDLLLKEFLNSSTRIDNLEKNARELHDRIVKMGVDKTNQDSTQDENYKDQVQFRSQKIPGTETTINTFLDIVDEAISETDQSQITEAKQRKSLSHRSTVVAEAVSKLLTPLDYGRRELTTSNPDRLAQRMMTRIRVLLKIYPLENLPEDIGDNAKKFVLCLSGFASTLQTDGQSSDSGRQRSRINPSPDSNSGRQSAPINPSPDSDSGSGGHLKRENPPLDSDSDSDSGRNGARVNPPLDIDHDMEGKKEFWKEKTGETSQYADKISELFTKSS